MMKELSERQLQALSKLEKLATAEGSSYNSVCKQIGISPPTISAIRKGTYTGVVDRQLQKVIDYFENKEAAAELYSGTGYKPTSISNKVYKIIKNCQLKGGLAFICGDSGIGKTQAGTQYCREHNTSCIYVTANPCIKSSKSILQLIGKQLNATAARLDELWMETVDKLSDGMIIIIDEAQHLSLSTIETLRSISDEFYRRNQTVGICFIGNEITVEKMNGKQKSQCKQIRNRSWHNPILSTKAIIKSDIEMLFPEIREDNVAIEFLLRIAQTPQALRGAVHLFSQAHDNENITYKGLVAAAKAMNLEV